MKNLVLLLALVGMCSARTITWIDPPKAWYGISLAGYVDDITGPNPHGVKIGDPLLTYVEEFGLEIPWDGGAAEFASTIAGNSPGLHASPLFYFLQNPVPWLGDRANPDHWVARIAPGGTVSAFCTAYGGGFWRINADTGSHRFSSAEHGLTANGNVTIVSGPITSIVFQQVPEPSVFLLTAPALVWFMVWRRSPQRG